MNDRGAFSKLQEAVAFAARAHQGQQRKDGETPYASHPFRVCLVLREVFGVADPAALTAAVLHDTIEDTVTDYDDLEEGFGADVAAWVGALSKDKRLPEAEREAAYVEQLRRGPWQVKLCKLADVYDNLTDMANADRAGVARRFKNAHRYLDAVRHDLPEEGRRAWEIVTALLADLEARETGAAGGA